MRNFLWLGFLCVSLQVNSAVEHSILPLMDGVYALDLDKKVNAKQREMMRYAADNKESKLRVMTYNMLYNVNEAEEKLRLKHRWNQRKPRLLEYIAFAKPDIIGSQELQEDQVKEVMAHWNAEYGCYGEKTRENEGRTDINAIFFNKSRLELLDSKTVAYSDPFYENGFTLCCFKDKLTGKEVVVINTKLTWGDADRRCDEAAQLNQYANTFSENVPVIVLGDFNTFPCLLHQKNIFLDGDYVEKVIAGKDLKDSKRKSIFGHFGPLCSITNSKDTLEPFSGPHLTGFILDHIFVNDQIDVFTHGIDTARVDEEFPSDHFPLIADLFIRHEK